MPVPAVTGGGSLTVSSGSMTATQDAMCGVPPTLNLIFRLGSVITAQSVTSLPVPAVVGTAIMGGIRDSIGLWPHSYSTMLPLCAATTPMPLAVSIELPPPIATRPSQPCDRYSAAVTILFNRNLVVDAAKVDSLPVPDDSRGHVDDDRDDVSGKEVVDGVRR